MSVLNCLPSSTVVQVPSASELGYSVTQGTLLSACAPPPQQLSSGEHTPGRRHRLTAPRAPAVAMRNGLLLRYRACVWCACMDGTKAYKL